MTGVQTCALPISQSAFQSDKAILDNILVAFETLHHMKIKKKGEGGVYGYEIGYD